MRANISFLGSRKHVKYDSQTPRSRLKLTRPARGSLQTEFQPVSDRIGLGSNSDRYGSNSDRSGAQFGSV